MLVSAQDGGWLKVEGLTLRAERATGYNLEVESDHTYFVGKNAAWVHNAGCGEIISRTFDSFEQSRNEALKTIGKIDPATRTPFIGRLGAGEGQVVGFTTRVDGVFKRFRIDYDPIKGSHINVEIGKPSQTYAFPFKGTEQDVKNILRSFQR